MKLRYRDIEPISTDYIQIIEERSEFCIILLADPTMTIATKNKKTSFRTELSGDPDKSALNAFEGGPKGEQSE